MHIIQTKNDIKTEFVSNQLSPTIMNYKRMLYKISMNVVYVNTIHWLKKSWDFILIRKIYSLRYGCLQIYNKQNIG